MLHGIKIIHNCLIMCQMIFYEEGDEDSTKLIYSSLEKVQIK